MRSNWNKLSPIRKLNSNFFVFVRKEMVKRIVFAMLLIRFRCVFQSFNIACHLKIKLLLFVKMLGWRHKKKWEIVRSCYAVCYAVLCALRAVWLMWRVTARVWTYIHYHRAPLMTTVRYFWTSKVGSFRLFLPNGWPTRNSIQNPITYDNATKLRTGFDSSSICFWFSGFVANRECYLCCRWVMPLT